MIGQSKSGRVIVNGPELWGRWVMALFVVALLTWEAHAQIPTAAEIATYTGSDRAQRLIEGHKWGDLFAAELEALAPIV
jgi:hypothetical protein